MVALREEMARGTSSQTDALGSTHRFKSATDDQATIIASGYFDIFDDFLTIGATIDVRDSTNNPSLLNVTGIDPTTVEVIIAGETQASIPEVGLATTAGGATTEQISAPGTLSGDIVLVTVRVGGTATVALLASTVTAPDLIDLTFNEDPLGTTILNYGVFRPQV